MSPSTTKFTHNRARTHERLGTTATKQNNNLAIVNRSRVSCAHCVESIYGPKYYTVTLKSKLRSLETEPLDGSCTTYYWSSYLTLNIIATLKYELQVTQDH